MPAQLPRVAVSKLTNAAVALVILTLIGAAVVLWPRTSVATADSVWEPIAAVVVSQLVENGVAVTAAPKFAPSNLNCTEATPTDEVTSAATVCIPNTKPGDGLLMLITGAGFATV